MLLSGTGIISHRVKKEKGRKENKGMQSWMQNMEKLKWFKTDHRVSFYFEVLSVQSCLKYMISLAFGLKELLSSGNRIIAYRVIKREGKNNENKGM